MKKLELLEKLTLLRRKHELCDYCWYSCPKTKYDDDFFSYCGEEDSDVCTCGADNHNSILDQIMEGVNEGIQD